MHNMTSTEAFECGVRCKNMDTETAMRTFYTVCGIHSMVVKSPEGYLYWLPDEDPSGNLLENFWSGYNHV